MRVGALIAGGVAVTLVAIGAGALANAAPTSAISSQRVFEEASAGSLCQDIVQGQAASPLVLLASSDDLLRQTGWTLDCGDPWLNTLRS